MNILIQGIVFAIVLFIYIHVYHHLKTSSDLELYELDVPTKEQLEEVCDVRQPVKFTFHSSDFIQSMELPNVEENYGVFDINIRSNQHIDTSISPFHKTQEIPLEQETLLPFLLTKSIPIFQKDQSKKYFSESNDGFLYETGISKKYRYHDPFLRPHMVSSCKYDYMFGSNKSITPLRYRVEYRTYYLVTYGQVNLTLIPPFYTKYLHPTSNYELFEFASPINPWNPQKEYSHDFEKIKTLTLTLKQGDIIYIPAYWWYSFEFEELSSLAVFHYQTYMNTVAILPQLTMYSLQHANVKHHVAKIENNVKIMSGVKRARTTQEALSNNNITTSTTSQQTSSSSPSEPIGVGSEGTNTHVGESL